MSRPWQAILAGSDGQESPVWGFHQFECVKRLIDWFENRIVGLSYTCDQPAGGSPILSRSTWRGAVPAWTSAAFDTPEPRRDKRFNPVVAELLGERPNIVVDGLLPNGLTTQRATDVRYLHALIQG